MKRVKARADTVSTNARRNLETWLRGMDGLTVIEGHARFEGPDTVRVGDALLKAPRIFINVGGRASVPDMPGVGTVDYLTNTSILQLDFRAKASGGCRRKLYRARIRADVPPLRRRGDGRRERRRA